MGNESRKVLLTESELQPFPKQDIQRVALVAAMLLGAIVLSACLVVWCFGLKADPNEPKVILTSTPAGLAAFLIIWWVMKGSSGNDT